MKLATHQQLKCLMLPLIGCGVHAACAAPYPGMPVNSLRELIALARMFLPAAYRRMGGAQRYPSINRCGG